MKTIHGDLIDVGLTGAQIEFNGKLNLQLIVRDVTQDFAYRQLLAEKTQIINSFCDGVVTFDLNGIVKSWNRACERMFGLKEAEVVGKPYSDLIFSGEQKSFAEDLLIPASKNDNYEIEINLKQKDNLQIKLTSSLLKNNKSEETGLVCYIREICS